MGINREKSYAKRRYLREAPIIKEGYKKLSLDCAKIIELLEREGSLKRAQIMKLTGIPKGTIDRRLNHLKKIGSITCAGGRYQAGPEPQDRQILAAMKQFRSESFHQLTIDTIASRAGVAPKEAEPTIYALARKLDLTIGTENVKRDASAIVGDKKAESWTPRTSEQENTPSHETTQN